MPFYPASSGTHQPEYNPGGLAIVNLTPEYVPGKKNPLFLSTETVVAGSKSIEYGLHRESNLPICLSIEHTFSGAPGAFSLDFQTADTNAEANFVTKQSVTAVNGNQACRMEIVNVVARYFRVVMSAVANPVTSTTSAF